VTIAAVVAVVVVLGGWLIGRGAQSRQPHDGRQQGVALEFLHHRWEVRFNVFLDRTATGHARIVARSINLPDGMTFKMWLRNAAVGFAGEAAGTMTGGRLVSPWFLNEGKPLPPGLYDIEVTSDPAPNQAASVREGITGIGENGERMSCRYTRTERGLTRVYFHEAIQVG
jgi:hypothetical protein